MASIKINLLVLPLAVICSGAHATSFDYSKARSPQEHMICYDPNLSNMDDRLAAAYATALQTGPSPDQVKSEQRQWMAERNRCSDAQCLTAAYSRRIASLSGSGSQPAQTQAAAPQSCVASIGKARASVLVKQCIQVSPATHPPCNDANPCDYMTDEIKRGCGMLTSNVPAFCRQAR